MASSGSVNSGGYQGRVLQFSWNTQSISSANNTRTISYTITAIGGSSSKYYHHNNVVSINDTEVYAGGSSDYITTNTILASGTFTINQSSTNTLTVKMNGGIYYYSDNINTTQSWTLDTIPRYTSISTFTVGKRDETSFTFNWGTTDTIDYAWYSTDNGSTWTGYNVADGTSGNFTVSGLAANTAYNCKLKVRRKDSQLETTSGTVKQTTYAYPYITTTPDFIIGNRVTLGIYNPLSRNCTITMYADDWSTIYSGDGWTGTSISGFNYQAAVDALYESIRDKKSGSYHIKVRYNNHDADKNNAGTYSIRGTETPTFSDFDYDDINPTTLALTGNNSKILIKGYSNNKITIPTSKKATAKNSATMKTYKAVQGTKSSGDLTYFDSDEVTTTLNAIDNNVITVSATDSRGLSTSVSKTLSSAYYKDYSALTIQSASAARDDSGVGESVTLTVRGTYWNNSFGNVSNDIITATYQYKQVGTSSWSSAANLTVTKSGSNYTISQNINGDLGTDGFDISKSYNVRVTIKDRLTTKTYDVVISSGQPAISIDENNNVAIGQKYDSALGGRFQVNGIAPYFLQHHGEAPADLNNAKIFGIYRISGTYTNAPVSSSIYGVLIVYESYGRTWTPSETPSGGGSWIWQEFRQANGATYIRNAVNTSSSWSNWQRVNNDASGLGVKTLISKGNADWINQTDGNSYLVTKSFMAYWNGAYNSSNNSNLTYAHEGTIQCKPIELYNNTTGTNGTVTLSQSAANFTYLEIFACLRTSSDGDFYFSEKIYSPNGKIATLTANRYYNDDAIQIIAGKLSINGTSITRDGTTFVTSSAGTISTHGALTTVYITRVVGYK